QGQAQAQGQAAVGRTRREAARKAYEGANAVAYAPPPDDPWRAWAATGGGLALVAAAAGTAAGRHRRGRAAATCPVRADIAETTGRRGRGRV
ncbi:MAG: hypothetical protein KDC33_13010, partial [Thermoleophilia bacterium]|nr:hypothetical protein [Thermoleophilia bacterium]